MTITFENWVVIVLLLLHFLVWLRWLYIWSRELKRRDREHDDMMKELKKRIQ